MRERLFIFIVEHNIGGVIVTSCSDEPEIALDETNVTQTGGLKSDSTREEYQGIIVLGEKLTNAYSVTNMQAAYTQLKSKKGDSVPTVRVTCTHWYVKLIPRNAAELELLKKDTSLVLFDFPLDYKITRMGSYYHDPARTRHRPNLLLHYNSRWLYLACCKI